MLTVRESGRVDDLCPRTVRVVSADDLRRGRDSPRQILQVDDGALTYPYSTRELVKVAKHLAAFPGDELAAATSDVSGSNDVDPMLTKDPTPRPSSTADACL